MECLHFQIGKLYRLPLARPKLDSICGEEKIALFASHCAVQLCRRLPSGGRLLKSCLILRNLRAQRRKARRQAGGKHKRLPFQRHSIHDRSISWNSNGNRIGDHEPPAQSVEAFPFGAGTTQRDRQHMKRYGFEERSDLEDAKNRPGVSAQFRGGRRVVACCRIDRDGREAGEGIVHQGHVAGISLRRDKRNQGWPIGRYLAATLRQAAGFIPRLCAAVCRRRHGASNCAAFARLGLLMARNCSKRRSGSQNYEEQRRNDFGEEIHANVVRMPIHPERVGDTDHITRSFLL